jgi:UDP-N-acetylglucosamine--N-acetylmuramyl-(pentapeptide) pyrophosphoryl-undecaprenol N-acetylglucosamine transferase
MRVVVTGGGTGGHVYPALEVAREAQLRGAELLYFGSLRGQERAAAEKAGVGFQGFRAEPIYSIKKPAGWKALLVGLKSSSAAKAALRDSGVDAVFSTGGYGAFPVLLAARSLGLKTVVHMIDSIPGRVNRLFVKRSAAVTCVFRHTVKLAPSAVRTGQPIRQTLREAASTVAKNEPLVLVTGGSQGSAFLNETAPKAAALAKQSARWLHSTGPTHIDAVRAGELPGGYDAVGFLAANEMADAYRRAMVVIGRSGGTLAEFALFRLPSILVPLPSSAEGHQLHNAKEFVEMGAADLLVQNEATPLELAQATDAWLGNVERRDRAAAALTEWDCPNATTDIVNLILTR